MVAGNEMLSARNLVEQVAQFIPALTGGLSDREVTQNPKIIVRLYAGLILFKDVCIHCVNTKEGAIAEADDVLVAKMRIGSEPVRHRRASPALLLGTAGTSLEAMAVKAYTSHSRPELA